MSKAEEIHYKAVIAADNQEPPKDYAISAHADHFNGFVEGYAEGYHQAEKDLALTWEDMLVIHRCIKDAMNYHLYKMMEGAEGQKVVYQEVLKRFLKERKEK